MIYTIYCTETGRIRGRAVKDDEDMNLAYGDLFDEEAILENTHADPYMQYIDVNTLEVIDRPIMDINIEGNIITGIPEGAEVYIEGDTYVINGGTLELSFDVPGTHKITFMAFPYLDKEVTIIET